MSRTETDADAEVRSAITALVSALIAYLVGLPSFFHHASARRVHHRRVGRHYRGGLLQVYSTSKQSQHVPKSWRPRCYRAEDEGSETAALSRRWWTYAVRRLFCCCLDNASSATSSSTTPTSSTTDPRTIDVHVLEDVYTGPVAVVTSDRHGTNVPPRLDEASVQRLKTIAVEDAKTTGHNLLTYKMLEDSNFELSDSKVLRREMRRGRRAALRLNRNLAVAGKVLDAFKRDYSEPQSALLTTLVKAHEKLMTSTRDKINDEKEEGRLDE
ncbi:unnamed protein product, partial [Mesorhabditis spiculigera]